MNGVAERIASETEVRKMWNLLPAFIVLGLLCQSTGAVFAADNGFSLNRYDEKQRAIYLPLYRDEVQAYEKALGDANSDAIDKYLRFHGRQFLTVSEEDKNVLPFCVQFAPSCGGDCDAVRDGFMKYLPKRFARRGFDYREVELDFSSADQSGGKAAAFHQFSEEVGCPHSLWIELEQKGPGLVGVRSDLQMKTIEKLAKNAISYVEIKPKQTTPVNSLIQGFVQTMFQLFSKVGPAAGASLAASSSDTDVSGTVVTGASPVASRHRLIRLQGVADHQTYVTIRDRIRSQIQGVSKCFEREIQFKQVDLVVEGSASLQQIGARLEQWTDFSIESIRADDQVLTVVLK